MTRSDESLVTETRRRYVLGRGGEEEIKSMISVLFGVCPSIPGPCVWVNQQFILYSPVESLCAPTIIHGHRIKILFDNSTNT